MLQAAAAAQSCFKRGKAIVDDEKTPTNRTRDGGRLIEWGTGIVRMMAEDQRKREEVKRGVAASPDYTEAEVDIEVTKMLRDALAAMPVEERKALEAVNAGD